MRQYTSYHDVICLPGTMLDSSTRLRHSPFYTLYKIVLSVKKFLKTFQRFVRYFYRETSACKKVLIVRLTKVVF